METNMITEYNPKIPIDLNSQQNDCFQNHAQYSKDKEENSHSNESIDKSNQNYRIMEYYNDSKNQQIKKKKIIQKNQNKNVIYEYKRIIKLTNQNLNEKQQQLEKFILREIPSQKTFFIAGDILVELNQTDDDLETCQTFNEFRNIVQVEKTESSLCFQLESVYPLQHITKIIYYLEGSQDQQLHDFAQYLKNHQETIYLINDQIAQLKQNYLMNSLRFHQIQKLRMQYLEEEKKKFISQKISIDEFCQVGTLTISIENQSSTISSMTFTRPTLALLGADDQEFAKHYLRKGFIKFFNKNARKNIFTSSMTFQMIQKQDYEIIVPNFQLQTIDNIKIYCECHIRAQSIHFPPHLQYEGQNIHFINQFDQLFYIKFIITPQILQQVIQIRAKYQHESPQHFLFPKNYDYNNDLELENLDYVMECQIFLQKFYSKMIEQLQNEQNQKEDILKQQQNLNASQQQTFQLKPCKFRYIN